MNRDKLTVLTINSAAIIISVGILFYLKSDEARILIDPVTAKYFSNPLVGIEDYNAETNAVPKIDSDNDFSFVVLGDTQVFDMPESEGGFLKTIDLIKKGDAKFIMTVGDLIQGCKDEDECYSRYEEWKSIVQDSGIRAHKTMGNHDRTLDNKSDEIWAQLFNDISVMNYLGGHEGTVYSFNFRNSHFVVLNSEDGKIHEIGIEQRNWLENDLNRNEKNNIFVFYHEPAFPVNYKRGSGLDYYEGDRNDFWKILDRHKVTAVFNGHEHMYSRMIIDQSIFPKAENEINQIVVGNTDAGERESDPNPERAESSYKGFNFIIVQVNNNEVLIEVISTDGEKIETYKL